MLMAAGFALLGTLAAGTGPVARRWAKKNGRTGNLKALLLGKAQSTPAKAEVHYFQPTGKGAQSKQADPASTDLVFHVAVPKGTGTAILRGDFDLA